MKNHMQAIKDKTYPVIAALWPNRLVRRSVQLKREARLPTEWRAFLTTHRDFRDLIMVSR